MASEKARTGERPGGGTDEETRTRMREVLRAMRTSLGWTPPESRASRSAASHAPPLHPGRAAEAPADR